MKSIETKYYGSTNSRGSRIKATDGDNSVTVSYDHSLNTERNHAAAALTLARKLKWTGTLIGGGTKAGYVFVLSTGEKFRI